jgi:hypothetical protein
MTFMQPLGAALALCACTPALAVGSLAEVGVFDRSNGRRLPVYWPPARPPIRSKAVT